MDKTALRKDRQFRSGVKTGGYFKLIGGGWGRPLRGTTTGSQRPIRSEKPFVRKSNI